MPDTKKSKFNPQEQSRALNMFPEGQGVEHIL